MNNMKTLIKKDFLFSIKWLPVFLIISAALPIYGASFAEANMFSLPITALSSAVVIAVLLYLSAICHLEDNPETEGLLGSLPLARKSRVLARYAACLALIAASLVIAVSAFAIAGGEMTAADVLWTAAIAVIHYAIFLYVFFKSGLQVAQYVPCALILGVVIAFKTDFIMELAMPAGLEYAAFVAAVAVFLFSAKTCAEE